MPKPDPQTTISDLICFVQDEIADVDDQKIHGAIFDLAMRREKLIAIREQLFRMEGQQAMTNSNDDLRKLAEEIFDDATGEAYDRNPDYLEEDVRPIAVGKIITALQQAYNLGKDSK